MAPSRPEFHRTSQYPTPESALFVSVRGPAEPEAQGIEQTLTGRWRSGGQGTIKRDGDYDADGCKQLDVGRPK